MGRQGAGRNVSISRGKKKKGSKGLCQIKMKGFPNSATSYKVKQCSVLRNSTLWALNFVVNLSKLSFFSSKITLKILRKAASLFLIQNILSSDSSAGKNSGKTLTGFRDIEQITDPFFFLISQNGEIYCELFFQTTEKLKGEKKIKWGDTYKV